MKVKAITPWFGGKRTLAPAIVTELGDHSQYFEPFCGSMAVLFAKEPCQKETVNDLHGDLVNLARVVADPDWGSRLYERLQSALFCESLLREASHHLDDSSAISIIAHQEKSLTEYGLERAYWYFLASWMGRNGTAGTARQDYQLAVRWTRNGGSPTVRWRNCLESMPAWHKRLSNVAILCRDAFRIIDRFEDHEKTAIYLDPPYVIDGDSRTGVKSGGDKSHTYQHEFSNVNTFFEKDDHERLRDILFSYKRARIVLSYYDCDRVRELYDGWTFVSHSRLKHLHNQRGGQGGKKAPELLIINGPSYGGSA